MEEDKTIDRASVLGLGTMGHGIAQTMAMAGCQVRGFDASADARASLNERVRANLNQMVELGVIEDSSIAATLGRITICDTETDALRDAQFVTEAVVEDLDVKRDLFARIEAAVEEAAILASNTSSYPMTQMSARMLHPERAIVTHWFNPPHIVPVVEIVPGEKTSEQTARTAHHFLNRIGKTAVLLNQEIPGFLVNRVQVAMFREILDLLDRNIAAPEEIDRAIRGSMGLRLAALGPLAIIDYAGWDVTARVYQNLVPHLRSNDELHDCAKALVDAGRIGAKGGQGVFAYPPESLPDQIADRDRLYWELVRATSEQRG